MNKTEHQKKPAVPFDIHQKLKANNSHLSYLKEAQPYQGNADYEFITTLVPEIEYSLYERCGNYFILVDFFKSYDEACQEAKKIIDNHPDIKQAITHRTNKY